MIFICNYVNIVNIYVVKWSWLILEKDNIKSMISAEWALAPTKEFAYIFLVTIAAMDHFPYAKV